MAIDGLRMLADAMAFATRAHRLQVRKNADRAAYIEHPVRVMHALLARGGVRDAEVLAAALLHDTVEDTDASAADVRAAFGARVAGIVAEVTDDKSLGKAARKRAQVAHVAGMSAGARLVKLADKLDNLTDLLATQPAGWTRADVQGYFAWSKAVVDAGLRGVCAPLEAEIDALWARTIHAPALADAPFAALPDASAGFVEAYYARIAAEQ